MLAYLAHLLWIDTAVRCRHTAGMKLWMNSRCTWYRGRGGRKIMAAPGGREWIWELFLVHG